MPYTLICNGMIQMKNKNKKQEEIKGENVGVDLHDLIQKSSRTL